MQDFKVTPCSFATVKPYLVYRHYARRVCSHTYRFALMSKSDILGVCVFGPGANYKSNTFGDFSCIELNRLFLEDGLPKNTASYFVSRCLKMLPKGIAIISYADPHQGHCGFIYQALGWFYLGQGQRRDGGWDSGVIGFVRKTDNKKIHARTFGSKYGECTASNAELHGHIRTFKKPKHKYVWFTLPKKQRVAALESCGMKSIPYPKSENIRYDTGSFYCQQGNLF